jgi:hypothetical protein
VPPTEAPAPAPVDAKNELKQAPAEGEASPLDSPTQSVERYEAARQQLIHDMSIPDFEFGLTVAPYSFSHADLRVGTNPAAAGVGSPSLFGLFFNFEKVLLRRVGLFSVGANAGFYLASPPPAFATFTPGTIYSFGPTAIYELSLVARQWVVPFAALGYEFLRYNFSYNNTQVKGTRTMPRVSAGLLFFLNPLEPSAAGQMLSSYGIKRSYLSVAYTIATPSGGSDNIDFTDRAFRAGLRFEY